MSGESFLVEEKGEGAAGEEEERYASDSDSDDDDVGRFVFLARQPAPAGPSEEGEGREDAMPSRGGGRGGRKRRLREMLLADDPPAAATEARPGPAAPRGASAEVSGSEGPADCSPERGDLFDLGRKNKKPRPRGGEPLVLPAVRGKGPQHRDVTAEQKAPVVMTAAAGAPRRFLCSMCGRCFGSHQALGGHVHSGHRRKAKDAIAAAAGHDEDVAGGGNGGRGVKLGQEAADGNAAHGEEKAAVAKKKVDFAAHHRDVDVDTRSFLGRNVGNINEDGGDEALEVDGNGSLAVAVGRPHGKARKTQHRCEVCGKECLSGQALGGHMRKHRKQSPPDGSKERQRSPELDWIPVRRSAVITGEQPRQERELGWI
ncbi:hypothetical protein D1007_29512 [Hordeum vulgare]|nr:hypothetical protein D1007_29512 [Hordeum vulgare]